MRINITITKDHVIAGLMVAVLACGLVVAGLVTERSHLQSQASYSDNKREELKKELDDYKSRYPAASVAPNLTLENQPKKTGSQGNGGAAIQAAQLGTSNRMVIGAIRMPKECFDGTWNCDPKDFDGKPDADGYYSMLELCPPAYTGIDRRGTICMAGSLEAQIFFTDQGLLRPVIGRQTVEDCATNIIGLQQPGCP